MAHIVDALTSFPEHILTGKELKNWLYKSWPGKTAQIDEVLNHQKISSRFFTLPINYYCDLHDVGKRNVIWRAEAQRLQSENIKKMLERNNLALEDIALICSVTSSGMSIPSLEALLMNEFAFSPRTRRLPIFGLGWLGGVSAINRVREFLMAYPDKVAIILAHELNSLNFQLDDDSDANIEATALYGDGAGLVLMAGSEHPLSTSSKFKVIGTESIFFPETENILSSQIVEEGLHLTPGLEVTSLVPAQVAPAIRNFLIKNKMMQEDLLFYLAHPGNEEMLEALSTSLELQNGELLSSKEALELYGNLSSVSIIEILARLLKADIVPQSLGLMMALGPAFSMELTLLKKVL